MPDSRRPEALAGHPQHRAAEAAGDEEAARRHERQLRRYDRGRFAAYLRGDGALSLRTDPPGAEVRLHRYTRRRRRMEPVFERTLGTTPLSAVPLEMGSYLLTLHREGHETVRYPVSIGRMEHWDGVGPDGPEVIVLPKRGELGPRAAYLPAGWYQSGTTEAIVSSHDARRRWLPSWVVQTHLVCNADYLAFLDDLVARGRADAAARYVPQERAANPGESGAPCFGLGEDGKHFLKPDADGDMWSIDWPVMLVDMASVQAYAEWWSARTGHAWQPIPELVWEKAARGVDGRTYPWGEHIDPSFANVRGSFAGKVYLAGVEDFALDVSAYGVRGLAGSVREWTADAYDPTREDAEAERVIRGGCWFFGAANARSYLRYAFGPRRRGDTIGFVGEALCASPRPYRSGSLSRSLSQAPLLSQPEVFAKVFGGGLLVHLDDGLRFGLADGLGDPGHLGVQGGQLFRLDVVEVDVGGVGESEGATSHVVSEVGEGVSGAGDLHHVVPEPRAADDGASRGQRSIGAQLDGGGHGGGEVAGDGEQDARTDLFSCGIDQLQRSAVHRGCSALARCDAQRDKDAVVEAIFELAQSYRHGCSTGRVWPRCRHGAADVQRCIEYVNRW